MSEVISKEQALEALEDLYNCANPLSEQERNRLAVNYELVSKFIENNVE